MLCSAVGLPFSEMQQKYSTFLLKILYKCNEDVKFVGSFLWDLN